MRSYLQKSHDIFIEFWTGKNRVQTANPTVFDKIAVQIIQTTLNSARYPAGDIDVYFAKTQISRLNITVWMSSITIPKLVLQNTLFVISFSKQSKQPTNTTIDILIRAQFDADVPANMQAFVMVLSNRPLKFQCDGNNISVIY